MTGFQRFQIEAARWADRQFGYDRSPHGTIAHLAKEVQELRESPYDRMEYVDCLMLLLDAASNARISIDSLLEIAWDKLDENRHREWGEPDEDGVVEHVREPCPHCKDQYAEFKDVDTYCEACGRLLPKPTEPLSQ